MRSTALPWTLALCLGACHAAAPALPGGGTDPGTGTDPGSGNAPGSVAEFQRCTLPADCATGLECAAPPWFGGPTYCMQPCAGGSCGADADCTDGYCTRRVPPYGVCGTLFDSCGPEAHCYGAAPLAPWRCVPRCDTSNTTAAQCIDPLPDGIVGSVPQCTTVKLNLQGLTMDLCVAEVYVGQRCDSAGLRCTGAARPDTDPTHEGSPDLGAVACLAAPDGTDRCLRICSADSGLTKSPCGCPSGDLLCTDPTAGLAWQCAGWPGLTSLWRACVPVEDCSLDPTVCADNVDWGLTSCGPTQLGDPTPVSTCQ